MQKKKILLGLNLILLFFIGTYFSTRSEQAPEDKSVGQKIESYEEARSIFWQYLYPSGGTTLYCNRAFNAGYNKGINIEHVFPMSWVAWKLGCGSRKQCRDNSQLFNRIEADLHNLYPSRSDINEARSSHPFGILKGEKRMFGSCDFELDIENRTVEPRPEVRGEIARAMFYMADQYDLIIHERQLRLLKSWHKQDPADASEIKRNQLIQSIQGNANPYIK